MIDGALPYVRCPVCKQSLARRELTLHCPAGHCFDLARQGYANLATGRAPHSGDTAEMVADRAAFLAAGHYDFIADALADLAAPALNATHVNPSSPLVNPGSLVVDAGTGTGHYLAYVLRAAAGAVGLGLDVSKPALRRAARSHARAAALLTDLWRPLPIADAAAAVILNVFAPRNGPEFRRILRSDGLLLVVTPAPDHLTELIAAHGLLHVDPDKATRVEDALESHFERGQSTILRRQLRLDAAEARTLIGMTPSAHHVATATLDAHPELITAAVTITAFRPK